MRARLHQVLVIDDDASFQRGLIDALEHLGYRGQASSAGEALEWVMEGAFDAVLLDLKMPELNGHALLRQLRRSGYNLPVIAMSGVGTKDDVVTLLREQATDYLQKPFNPSDLGAALDRALSPPTTPSLPDSADEAPAAGRGLRVAAAARTYGSPRRSQPAFAQRPTSGPVEVAAADRPSQREPAHEPRRVREPLKELLADLKAGRIELPVIAPVTQEIQELGSRPTCGIADVMSVVGQDPAITASILRIANSSQYRPERPITNLRAACLRLGNKRVLAIAQQVLVQELFGSGPGPVRTLVQAMWRNLLVTAHGARELAMLVDHPDPDAVQVAAMMHNLGEVVLVRLLADLKGAGEADETFALQAAGTVAENHEAVGRLLLQGWKMPPAIVALAGDHHRKPLRPEGRSQELLRHLVTAAWTCACRGGFDYLPGQAAADPGPALEALGLDEAAAAAVFEHAGRWLGEGDEAQAQTA